MVLPSPRLFAECVHYRLVRCLNAALIGKYFADATQRRLKLFAGALHIESAITRASGVLVGTQAAAELVRVVTVEGSKQTAKLVAAQAFRSRDMYYTSVIH
jgi:hypothetical protein